MRSAGRRLPAGDVVEGAGTADRARTENFPVASHLLPRAWREHLMAIYAFARMTDDTGDEFDGDRLERLSFIERELEAAEVGRATHPVMQQLGRTISATGLDVAELRNLIEANRRDQYVHRYESIDDLMAYCRLSAAPVGRLVLTVFGGATAEQVVLSDDVCAGLQITEHLQDVREDALAGRIYLPLEDLRRFGCLEGELSGCRAGEAVRRLVLFEVDRARLLLSAGVRLAQSLPARQKVAVAGYTAGGLAALDAIVSASGDVLANDCRPRPLSFAKNLAGVLATRRTTAPASARSAASLAARGESR
jgi:squalene synthase HpnC